MSVVGSRQRESAGRYCEEEPTKHDASQQERAESGTASAGHMLGEIDVSTERSNGLFRAARSPTITSPSNGPAMYQGQRSSVMDVLLPRSATRLVHRGVIGACDHVPFRSTQSKRGFPSCLCTMTSVGVSPVLALRIKMSTS